MKRLVLYALILTFVWIIPVEPTDVAKLRPIEVIAVYQTKDSVSLATDTGDFGIGVDVMSALADMRQKSPAVIYLDTAEYLLIEQGAERAAEELRKDLKTSVKLCGIKGEVILEDAAKYLDIHGQLPSLRQWQVSDSLPILAEIKGRLAIK